MFSWNVDADGSDYVVMRQQLKAMQPSFDMMALSEVPSEFTSAGTVASEFGSVLDDALTFTGVTGGNSRLSISFNQKKFKALELLELEEHAGVRLGDESNCAPLVVTLKHIESNQQFRLVNNHFAREDTSKRNQQARLLADWTRNQSLPVIAVGDFNLDYDFKAGTGNETFSVIQRGGFLDWIRPISLIETCWVDENHDGKNDFPNLMQDFVFVSGLTQTWDVRVRVLQRQYDFPDDELTSDHRPLLAKITILK